MTSTSQPSGATRVCRRIARGGAGGAIGIGFIVLVGWIFGIEALPRLALGCAPMEASTALGVMFSGLALWLLLDESRLTRPRRVAVRALAVTVLAIAASTVVGSVQQRDFGLEHLLFPDQSAAAQAGPMAVTTAAGFVGYALALLLAISRVHRAALVAQVLAAFVAGHALLALAAYLYGATDSVGQSARGGLAPLGLITSIVFLGLSTSLICARPHFGLAATLGSPRVGGVMARCILPLTVLLPFVVGGLRLAGEVSGAFDTRFGVALFATVNAVLFSVIVWLSARWLNRTDAARQHAQEETLAAMRNLHQAHQQLQHGKQLLRLAVTNARIGTWLWTPADDRIVASELWFELHGLRPAPHSTREQMLAHIHPDDREHVLRGGENAVRARGEYEAEYRTISLNDAVRWIVARGRVETEGDRVYLTGVALDATERKRSEAALRDSSRFNEQIIRSLQEGIAVLDVELRNLVWNPFMERLTGLPASTVLGRRPEEIFPDVIDEGILASLQRALAGELVEMPEREFSTPGNSARYWLTRTYAPLRAGNGEIIGVIINLNDVTERRNTTLTLQESRARFESIIASAMDAIITVDAEQKIMLFNSAAERLFRCEAEQAVGTSLERFLPESVRTAHREHLRAFGRTGASSRAMGRLGVLHGVRANGEHFPIEASISHATLGGQKWFTVILRDVSERVAAEAALKESEARFRQLAENIDAVFWMREVAEDRLLYISPAYERVWGRRCSELLQSPESWLDAVHPDDRDRIQHAAAMMVERGSYEGVYRILRPDGTIRWIQDRGYPIRDDTGNIHRFAGTATDITSHRQLEEQFRQAQKMEAIGTLAGGIAHDFNNILAAINGYTELARMELPPEQDEIREYLDAVSQAGGRATDLVRQILTFSRRQEVSHELISLGPVVQEAVRLLRATIPATVEFTVTLSPDLPPVLADPTEIHQIVMNLGTNAWHAMREKPGRLHLTLEAFQVDPELADTHRQLRVGSYVRLSISDTGHGMDRSTLERIFEPFFTTKDPGEGTGLGLSVVHGIMEAQDGAITVYSEPGQGTTFHLYFPAREASGLTLVQPAHTEVRGRGERILLVDDEAPLARLGEKVLGGLGYVVEPYSSAEGALAAFRADPTRYAAVVTDQTMPGLTGIELAREIIGVRPLTPVILITGYTAALDRRHLQKFGITEVLSKPHTRQSLGAAVHRALRELETRGGT